MAHILASMSDAHSWTLRTASARDAEKLAMVLREGFESYRSFAPLGWEPPSGNWDLDLLRGRLRESDVWCLLAEADDDPIGHVSLLPAAKHARHPSSEPALAQLWHLFVRMGWWGSGLATELHREVLREAGGRGYRAMRLFTPLDQARALRFYEREGWTLARAPVEAAPGFGMPLAELRRAINSSV
jgi:GNAT superfamily N-acetyltransferase